MASANKFQGLANGPIGPQVASTNINAIANGSIDMGSVVELVNPLLASDILPRVISGVGLGGFAVYGVAVHGDVDGIYGDGTASVDDSTRATNAAGQSVSVVTQGRCLARVSGGAGAVIVGDSLIMSATTGVLVLATVANQKVIARALNNVAGADTDMIAVDVQREGGFHGP